jgi:dUTPase
MELIQGKNMVELPVFKFALRDDLDDRFIPKRATNVSSGWDVFCACEPGKSISLRPGEYAKIPLGFRVMPDKGWWLQLVPRSSTFAKKNLNCLYGTIDTDYRGYLVFAIQYLPDLRSLGTTLEIKFGEAIGQLIPVKLQEMKVNQITNKEFDELCKKEENSRGPGGFGSTDKIGFYKTGTE